MATMESPNFDYEQWVNLPEDDNDVTTRGTAPLVPGFESSEQMMQSRLVEDTNASGPMSLPSNTALQSGHVAEWPTPLLFEPGPVDAHLWLHSAPVMGLYESPSPVGLGLSLPATYAGPSTGLMSVQTHWLVSETAWDEPAPEAGYRGEADINDIQSSTETYSLVVDPFYGSSVVPSQAAHQEDLRYLFNGDLSRAQPLNIPESASITHLLPSLATDPSLQGSLIDSAHAWLPGPAYHLQSPVLPTPSRLASLPTPDSSGASTISSPASTVPTFSPRRKRPHRSTLYRRTQSTPGSSMASKDVSALENAREGVRNFVRDHPHDVEPSIGDPAAIAIIGGNLNVGTPGKSIYSAFFGRNGKSPLFTCHECGHAERRFPRAVRHQRQDHFQHYPFRCEGGTGHLACGQWFSSDEYVKDHIKKAGPTTFLCSICLTVLTNSGNLGRHKKRVHHA